MQAGDRRETLRVLGLVETADPESGRSLDGLLLLDVGAAQRLLGMPGRISHVDLILTGGEAAVAAVARLAAAGRRAWLAASEQASTAAQLTAAFELNLRALSLLALVVGMFLVYNTVLFGVVQRRAIFGTLRTLGATPGQLFRLILAETLLLRRRSARALGLGLGYWLGQSAVRLVTRTINDLYYVVSVSGAPLTPETAVKARRDRASGPLFSPRSGPALEAARVEPVTALRPSTFEARARRLVPWLAAAGVVLALAGAAALVVARRSLLASFAGLFGVVLGHRAHGAGVHRGPDGRSLRPLASRLGPVGRLATGHGGARGEPHRRRRRGADGRRVGHDRGERDDRELPLDGRQLAGADAPGRRLRLGPVLGRRPPRRRALGGRRGARGRGAGCRRGGDGPAGPRAEPAGRGPARGHGRDAEPAARRSTG